MLSGRKKVEGGVAVFKVINVGVNEEILILFTILYWPIIR
jgi:hypothetical protein